MVGRRSRSPPIHQERCSGTGAVPKITPPKHRVLMYVTCYNILDGVTLTARKLEREILAAGHSVCVLTTKSGDARNTNLTLGGAAGANHPNRKVLFIDNGLPIHFLNDPNHPDNQYQLGFSLSWKVQKEIEEFEPSVIHLMCPDSTAFHLIQYARRKEIPILGTYHSNIPEYMEHYPGVSWLKPVLGAFFRHQYNFLQALYVPTPYIQQYLSDEYRMDRVTNLRVWGHGVDIEKFHPSHRSSEFRRKYGVFDNDQTVILLWVSRLVPEKRPDIFASVVKRLSSRGCNFKALVVGAGPAEGLVKSLPNTTFCGWMNADELAVAYASSDVFLFPSSVETFGLVTLEAAASGLPVVVEEGCSGHLVRNGESGYACPEGDVDAFFGATLKLVTNQEKRWRFSKASRQLARTWEERAIIRRMLDNYSQVTDEFYTEYGGHHANRDSDYRRPGSFVAGSHPRPLLLVLVEYIFISVVLYLTKFQACLRGLLCLKSKEDALTSSNVIVELEDMLSSRGEADSVNLYDHAVTTTSMSSSDGIGSLAVAGSDDTGSAGDSIVSNATFQDEFSAGSSNDSQEKHHRYQHKESSIGRTISHGLAKAFVRTVEFQCFCESYIRNALSSQFKDGDLRTFQAVRKRKNSNIADANHTSLSGDASCCFERPSLISRARSDGSGDLKMPLLKDVQLK